ncbi:hypothetical protein Hanom_Chr02g00118061 [Helianthus anomalus]
MRPQGRESNDSSLKIVDVPEIVVQVLDLKPIGNRYVYWFGDEDDRDGGWSYSRDSYQLGFPAKKVRTNHSLALIVKGGQNSIFLYILFVCLG